MRYVLIALVLLILPTAFSLGETLVVETNSGDITINVSRITGTNISCNNIIDGTDADFCTDSGGGGNVNGSDIAPATIFLSGIGITSWDEVNGSAAGGNISSITGGDMITATGTTDVTIAITRNEFNESVGEYANMTTADGNLTINQIAKTIRFSSIVSIWIDGLIGINVTQGFIQNLGFYTNTEIDTQNTDINNSIPISTRNLTNDDNFQNLTQINVLLTDINASNTDDQNSTEVNMSHISEAAYFTLQDYIQSQGSTGMIAGGIAVGNPNGTINVSGGQIYIRKNDSRTGPIVTAAFDREDFIELTNNSNNFIWVEYNGGSPRINVTPTPLSDVHTNVIANVVFRDSDDTHITNVNIPTSQVSQKLSKRLVFVNGLSRQSGSVITEISERLIAITVGAWWLALTEFTIPAFDSSGSDTFQYYYRDGSGGFIRVENQTQINNTLYDDGSGTLGVLSNNKYGAHWVYIQLDGDVVVIYGTGDYTLVEAEEATAPSVIPLFLTGFHSALVGKVIIQKSSTTFNSLQNPFDTVFGFSTIQNHADLSQLDFASAGHTGFASTVQIENSSIIRDYTASLGHVTGVFSNLAVNNTAGLGYQNITNFPTCTGDDVLTFDGTTMTCTTPSGGGGGGGDKWVDDGTHLSPNTTFGTDVNASLLTSNFGTNITKDGIVSTGTFNGSAFYDDGVLLITNLVSDLTNYLTTTVITTLLGDINNTIDTKYTGTQVNESVQPNQHQGLNTSTNAGGDVSGTFSSLSVDTTSGLSITNITDIQNSTNITYDSAAKNFFVSASFSTGAHSNRTDEDIQNLLNTTDEMLAATAVYGGNNTAQIQSVQLTNTTIEMLAACSVYGGNNTAQIQSVQHQGVNTTSSPTSADISGSFSAGLTIDNDAVQDDEIDFSVVTLIDFTNDANFIANDTDAKLLVLNVTSITTNSSAEIRTNESCLTLTSPDGTSTLHICN